MGFWRRRRGGGGVDLEVLKNGEQGVVRVGDEGAAERREDGKSVANGKEKKAFDW